MRVAIRWLEGQGKTSGRHWDDPPDPPEPKEYPAGKVIVYWYPTNPDPANPNEGYEVTMFVDTNQDTQILQVLSEEGGRGAITVPVEEFEKMVPEKEMRELEERAIEAAQEQASEEWEDEESAAADFKYDAWKDEQAEKKYGQPDYD